MAKEIANHAVEKWFLACFCKTLGTWLLKVERLCLFAQVRKDAEERTLRLLMTPGLARLLQQNPSPQSQAAATAAAKLAEQRGSQAQRSSTTRSAKRSLALPASGSQATPPPGTSAAGDKRRKSGDIGHEEPGPAVHKRTSTVPAKTAPRKSHPGGHQTYTFEAGPLRSSAGLGAPFQDDEQEGNATGYLVAAASGIAGVVDESQQGAGGHAVEVDTQETPSLLSRLLQGQAESFGSQDLTLLLQAMKQAQVLPEEVEQALTQGSAPCPAPARRAHVAESTGALESVSNQRGGQANTMVAGTILPSQQQVTNGRGEDKVSREVALADAEVPPALEDSISLAALHAGASTHSVAAYSESSQSRIHSTMPVHLPDMAQQASREGLSMAKEAGEQSNIGSVAIGDDVARSEEQDQELSTQVAVRMSQTQAERPQEEVEGEGETTQQYQDKAVVSRSTSGAHRNASAGSTSNGMTTRLSSLAGPIPSASPLKPPPRGAALQRLKQQQGHTVRPSSALTSAPVPSSHAAGGGMAKSAQANGSRVSNSGHHATDAPNTEQNSEGQAMLAKADRPVMARGHSSGPVLHEGSRHVHEGECEGLTDEASSRRARHAKEAARQHIAYSLPQNDGDRIATAEKSSSSRSHREMLSDAAATAVAHPMPSGRPSTAQAAVKAKGLQQGSQGDRPHPAYAMPPSASVGSGLTRVLGGPTDPANHSWSSDDDDDDAWDAHMAQQERVRNPQRVLAWPTQLGPASNQASMQEAQQDKHSHRHAHRSSRQQHQASMQEPSIQHDDDDDRLEQLTARARNAHSMGMHQQGPDGQTSRAVKYVSLGRPEMQQEGLQHSTTGQQQQASAQLPAEQQLRLYAPSGVVEAQPQAAAPAAVVVSAPAVSSALVAASLTAEKMSSILSYLDQAEMQVGS